jgi:hypothetical protein
MGGHHGTSHRSTSPGRAHRSRQGTYPQSR